MDQNSMLAKWEEVKALVFELEVEVHKNVSGNASAGTKARKGLRGLRGKLTELVKLSLDQEKVKRAAKAVAKTA